MRAGNKLKLPEECLSVYFERSDGAAIFGETVFVLGSDFFTKSLGGDDFTLRAYRRPDRLIAFIFRIISAAVSISKLDCPVQMDKVLLSQLAFIDPLWVKLNFKARENNKRCYATYV